MKKEKRHLEKEIKDCYSANEQGYIIPINLDFDGCCVEHCFPYVGETNGNVVKILQRWIERYNVGLILNTSRSSAYLDDAINWFEKNNICLWAIGKNPTQETWTDSNKSYGFYIDDMCAGIPLIEEDGKRPRVDWDKLCELFEPTLEKIAKSCGNTPNLEDYISNSK